MDEFESVTLRDPSSSLTATYVPVAGMVGTSLADDGVELLGQRRGVHAYVSNGKTMGIPILYPWANRLSSNGYGVDGAVVSLTPGTGGVRADQHGVPIHGTLAAYPDWLVTTLPGVAADRRAGLRGPAATAGVLPVPASADAGDHAAGPHADGQDDGHRRRRVAGAAVLRLPPVPATARCAAGAVADRDTRHALPARERVGHPHRPGGGSPGELGAIGDKFVDDGYDEVAPGSVFALSGGDRRIEVHFDKGFTAAQLFAPGDDDVVCFEPMAAPTDALRRGGYHEVQPGESVTAQFRIKVT